MKKLVAAALLGLSAMGTLVSSCTKDAAVPAGAPAVLAAPGTQNAVATNGVMLQGFYWNTPTTTAAGTWWQNLGSKAQELSDAGITAVWLPPAYKGGSASDVGYGVYDRYDLGEFNQKGTVATRYGTISQLQSAITSLHGKGIQVYEDMVMNHLTWADAQETVNGNTVYTKFNYPGRGATYSSYRWSSANFTGTQQAPNNGWYQWKSWDFQPYANNDAYDNLLGSEIQYNGNSANQTETINWGNWITTKLNLDGYRLDATKHIYTPYVNQWLDAVKGTRFAVSEAWFRNLTDLNNYAASTGGRTSLFDVPLHYTFQDMSNGNGAWDMRGLQFAGFTEANGPLSVSFVDNHDTDQQGGALYSPVVNLKMLAYAYILTRAKGYPCVFYRDYYEYGLGAQIKKLISIRKANAYGAGNEYTSINDADLYAYSRAGDATHAGLLLLLNDGSAARSKGITTPFKSATLTDKTGNNTSTVTTDANGYGVFPVNARSYSAWVPGTGTTTPPPTSTTTAVTFNVTYSNTVTGQDVYIIGSTAQLGSWNTANAIKLSGAAYPKWSGTVNLTSGTAVQYKYIRKDAAGNVLWEGGANRAFTPSGTSLTRTDTWQ
ncbi:alpha-amylase domain-containing protein [Hymenobacter sp. DG25B]|uniref:alpha-amylase domain-containing protein n=1 Tax=Hymenobacter sp. DG25B TaxID=1385664 RepID=UPI0009E4CD97|nr:alpha-amylase domain-containing protein [Hymenobacter sp. DG25B]